MNHLTVIKIGGNIVENPIALEDFLQKFSQIPAPKILIHGGGSMASEMAQKLGIQTQMHKGRRITDYQTLKMVTMVYAGWINKSIVAKLQKVGCNAIGLSGADCNVVPATKRAADVIDFGYVGDVNPAHIDNNIIMNFLGRGICPVFCAITHDKNGSLLNTNADTMASSIAIAMSSQYCTKLIYCFEKEGVLFNQEDPTSIIPLLTRSRFEELQEEGVIVGGMIPKIENAFYATENGVEEVVIKHAANLDNNKGTLLK